MQKPLSPTVSLENAEENKAVEDLRRKFKDKNVRNGKLMEVKTGRFGPFLGCSGYPECKNIMPIIVFSGEMFKCSNGQLVERHTRKGGKIFWGCNKFPKCKNATWHKLDLCDKCKIYEWRLREYFVYGV